MARQGHMLETVAINELKVRRERLDGYQAQARFAVADSYDRAARLQADMRPEVPRRAKCRRMHSHLASSRVEGSADACTAPDMRPGPALLAACADERPRGTLAQLTTSSPMSRKSRSSRDSRLPCRATGATSRKRPGPR